MLYIYRALVNSADYVVADGTGVVMASKLLQTPLKERVPGIELMEVCLNIANEQHQKVVPLNTSIDPPTPISKVCSN